MDFVHDQLATGRKLRVLTIVDTFSRFSPAVDARFSYRGEDVVATLERVCAALGFPKSIRVGFGFGSKLTRTLPSRGCDWGRRSAALSRGAEGAVDADPRPLTF